jgi:branched-chain amino acid transport system substrate-binding protein
VMFISDVHSLGLKLAQGLIITEAYYWDLNDKTRAFGKALLRTHEADAHHESGRDL